MSTAEETHAEADQQVEAGRLASPGWRRFARWGLCLAILALIVYLGWRLNQSERQLQQQAGVLLELQNDELDYRRRLAITAGQLNIAINAVELARMQRDDGQKALRDLEDRLAESRREREALAEQLEAHQTQNRQLSNALAYASSALAEAESLPAYLYPGSAAQAADFIAEAFPSQGAILTSLIAISDQVRWQYQGDSLAEGLDSRGLAVHLLAGCGLAADAQTLLSKPLAEVLESVTLPAVGDLVHYQDEYYLFFFLDAEGLPFVAGMTPYGIQLFKYDFKEILQIYRLPYGEGMECSL